MKNFICWMDDKLEVVIGSIFLALMVLFTFIQIVGRYVLTTPFSWTEEMTRYMFVWMVYIAVGYAVKEDKHIRITFLHSLLPKKAGKILD
ncbi:TRAP transporter small permease, partial [Clostridium sediminicola]|uniref:TRAP transporter small permease n=1 Tax=Clostridium sediminicola TaxID=3114879 RepID=UPI003D17B471